MKFFVIVMFCGVLLGCVTRQPATHFDRRSMHGVSLDVPFGWVHAIGVDTGDTSFEHRGFFGKVRATIELQTIDWSEAQVPINSSEWIARQVDALRISDAAASVHHLEDLGSLHRIRVDLVSPNKDRLAIVMHWADTNKEALIVSLRARSEEWASHLGVFEHVVASVAPTKEEPNQSLQPTAPSGRG